MHVFYVTCIEESNLSLTECLKEKKFMTGIKQYSNINKEHSYNKCTLTPKAVS